MKKLLVVYKEIGQTPLEAVTEFKKKNKEYGNEKISYAGRLDPMAEGVLLLLVGAENKEREKYLDLNKEYESEIVLGIETDTFDALGLIKKVNLEVKNPRDEIEKCLETFLGKSSQSYPPYSSKTVGGKPLYWWVRENRLSEIEIPKKEIEIYRLEIIGAAKVSGRKLREVIIRRVKSVNGDFRQGLIEKTWESFEKSNKDYEFDVLKIKVSCSSGTYVRRLASDIGKKLGVGAFCLSIKRTSVGNFTLSTEALAEKSYHLDPQK